MAEARAPIKAATLSWHRLATGLKRSHSGSESLQAQHRQSSADQRGRALAGQARMGHRESPHDSIHIKVQSSKLPLTLPGSEPNTNTVSAAWGRPQKGFLAAASRGCQQSPAPGRLLAASEECWQMGGEVTNQGPSCDLRIPSRKGTLCSAGSSRRFGSARALVYSSRKCYHRL